jgi:hypothetical protein
MAVENENTIMGVIESEIGGSPICEAVKQIAGTLFETSLNNGIAWSTDDILWYCRIVKGVWNSMGFYQPQGKRYADSFDMIKRIVYDASERSANSAEFEHRVRLYAMLYALAASQHQILDTYKTVIMHPEKIAEFVDSVGSHGDESKVNELLAACKSATNVADSDDESTDSGMPSDEPRTYTTPDDRPSVSKPDRKRKLNGRLKSPLGDYDFLDELETEGHTPSKPIEPDRKRKHDGRAPSPLDDYDFFDELEPEGHTPSKVIESELGGSPICESVKQIANTLFESDFNDILDAEPIPGSIVEDEWKRVNFNSNPMQTVDTSDTETAMIANDHLVASKITQLVETSPITSKLNPRQKERAIRYAALAYLTSGRNFETVSEWLKSGRIISNVRNDTDPEVQAECKKLDAGDF